MKYNPEKKIILLLSSPLAILIIVASCFGIFMSDFYSKETINWQSQSFGQDLIDLFIIAPALIFTTILVLRNSRIGILSWAGTNMYIVYTFIIYCFNVHFNQLFLVYCFCLGLSFYSITFFVYYLFNNPMKMAIKNNVLIRTTGIYFLIISFVFYFLWLSEIIPANLNHSIPKSIAEAGAFTNAVHVLDLSVLIPGILLTGVLLLRKKQAGFILTPIMLIFFILMDITIAGLMIIMNQRGEQTDLSIALVMGILAIISIGLLYRYYLEMKNSNHFTQ